MLRTARIPGAARSARSARSTRSIAAAAVLCAAGGDHAQYRVSASDDSTSRD